ncbi:conserved hypothetical protein [[Clostridium] ultunense Esp]|nr:conserved hypothetical protein [[Clostridium] ultunense Esp]
MDLKPLLSPDSVAIIGASNREGSLGYDTVRMIKKSGYKGEVYPINPKYEEILGYKVYPDLESIGKPVDTVVLCIAARRVEEQVDIAIKAKVKSLIIFANCVLEGDTTPNLEERIIERCKKANIPLMGHNAMGFYNNDIDLRVCGFEAPDEGTRGNVALISQSGSVFSTIGHNEPQLKFNLMVATGTGQITSLSDYMIYALEQETTKVLGVYMESVRKPERFKEALELAAKKRIPIVAMKVGKSELGAKFAKSHTGGMAGDDDAIQAVFDHYGVIRVDSLCEMANTLLLFSYYPEIPKGGLVAIADSGGERNLLADDAETIGLEFAKLSDETMNKLQDIQEYGQDASNPLDPWGTGIDFEEIFGSSLALMLEDDNAALGIISQDLRDGYYLSAGCVQALKQGKDESGKPVAFLTNFSGTRRTELTRNINSLPAPVLMETKPALKAVKNLFYFRDFEFKEMASKELRLSEKTIDLIKNKDVLQEAESMSVLKELGFPVNESIKIYSKEDLEKNKDKIKYPVVLKTAVDGILHKADVGGVKLNIGNYEELEKAYLDMSNRLGDACIVTRMLDFDIELIFGMKSDPTFGPLVIVGGGGIYTELLNDKIVLLPQSTGDEILRKLKTLKTYKLLTGYRGSQPVDIEKLVNTIMDFCQITKYLGQWVKEIDINPVAIIKSKIIALDSLIICE